MLNRLTLCLALTYCLTLTATPLMAEANLDPAAPSQPGAVALYLSALTLRDLQVALQPPAAPISMATNMMDLDPLPPEPRPMPKRAAGWPAR